MRMNAPFGRKLDWIDVLSSFPTDNGTVIFCGGSKEPRFHYLVANGR